MIRKKNLYVKPKKAFESSRIQEENELLKSYGLKNKKEVWKTLAKVNYFRKRAMELAHSTPEEQESFFNKLRALGLKVESGSDVLGLKVDNLLERRLPTVVFKKNLSNSVKHARQLVVHKKVLINGKVVNTPGYLVSLSEEDSIALKEKKAKPKVEEPKEETTEENSEAAPAEETTEKSAQEETTESEEKPEEAN